MVYLQFSWHLVFTWFSVGLGKLLIYYGDNSELHGVRGANIPDVFLFGGFAVRNDLENKLSDRLHQLKCDLGIQRCAVKWNMRDLQKEYRARRAEQKYEDVLSVLPEYREGVFQIMAECETTAIVAVIESHSVERRIIKNKKSTLSGYAFSILLARIALHANELGEHQNTIVLDWPDKGERGPFDDQYRFAFNFGESGGFKYSSGPLANCCFRDSIFFSAMTSTEMLQLADQVVGVSKDNVQAALDESKNPVGVSYRQSLMQILRGYPKKIPGYGVIAYSARSGFRASINEYFSEG